MPDGFQWEKEATAAADTDSVSNEVTKTEDTCSKSVDNKDQDESTQSPRNPENSDSHQLMTQGSGETRKKSDEPQKGKLINVELVKLRQLNLFF